MLAEVSAQVEAGCPGHDDGCHNHCGGCGCHNHCCHCDCDSTDDDPEPDPCDCVEQIKTCSPTTLPPNVPIQTDFPGIVNLFDTNADKCMQICEFKFFYDNNYLIFGSQYGALDDVHMCEWFN